MATDILKAALETQVLLLNELINLLQRETGELAAIHLDAMAAINGQKELLTARSEAHSTVLQKAIEEAAIREGLSSKATLGELAAKCKKRGNNEISRLHGELNRLAERARETIGINAEIAERFAASVTSSLELLTRVINQSTTYGSSGDYQQRPASAVMINREV
jgi:flagellar biosynthesis/type III secretory pathway chaperone